MVFSNFGVNNIYVDEWTRRFSTAVAPCPMPVITERP